MAPLYNIVSNLRKNVSYFHQLTLSAHHVDVDLSDLLDALKSNTMLHTVQCHAKFLQHLTASEFTLLLQAIATLPQLQSLSISLPSNRSHLSSLVVTECVQYCPRLASLTLVGANDEAMHAVAAFVPHLTNLSLKHVESHPCHDNAPQNSIHALAEALQDPICGLQSLSLTTNLNQLCIKAFATALQTSGSLKTLHLLSTACSDEDLDYTPLLEALKYQQHETLHSLQTPASSEVQSALDFHTRLNRVGVSQLLQKDQASHNDWLDLVESSSIPTTSKQEDDLSLSALYHVVRQDPRFLLAYDATHDHHADDRSLKLLLKSESTIESIPTHTPTNPLRRQKAVNPPLCYALNLPL